MTRTLFRPVVLLAAIAALVGIYAIWWFARLHQFKQDIAALGEKTAGVRIVAKQLDFGGFPYRLEMTATDVTLTRARADYTLAVSAPEMKLIRQPWAHDFVLGAITRPKILLTAKLAPAFAPITATAVGGQLSVRTSAKGVQRLSVTFENYQGTVPWVPGKISAGHLEFHGREFAAHDRLPKWLPDNPVPPAIIELYMSGENMMLDRGPFRLTARAEITGDPKFPHGYLRLSDWARGGGTLELKTLSLERGTLSDTVVRGTVALDANARVIGGLTIDTSCASWLYDYLAQPKPAVLPKCGNLLRPYTVQIQKSALTLKPSEP